MSLSTRLQSVVLKHGEIVVTHVMQFGITCWWSLKSPYVDGLWSPFVTLLFRMAWCSYGCLWWNCMNTNHSESPQTTWSYWAMETDGMICWRHLEFPVNHLKRNDCVTLWIIYTLSWLSLTIAKNYIFVQIHCQKEYCYMQIATNFLIFEHWLLYAMSNMK